MQLSDRIVATPDTCDGHPRVDGTRIRVSSILGWLAAGMTETEIIADYPPLTTEQIRAALAFSASVVEAPGWSESALDNELSRRVAAWAANPVGTPAAELHARLAKRREGHE